MINIDKSFAIEILNKLVAISPHAILAGGACRDIIAGVKPNDFDFYLYSPATTIGTVVRQFKAIGIDAEHRERSKFAGAYEEYNEYLRWVFDAVVAGNKCQFMILTENVSVDKLLEQFPVSNSKAYINCYRNEVIKTKDFIIGEKIGLVYRTNDKYSPENPYIQKIATRFGKVWDSFEDALLYGEK